MALVDIIDYCVTQVAGLPSTGIVRDHEMLITDDRGWRDFFTVGDIVNVVEITRRATPAQWLANQRTVRQHDIIMHVYYGLLENTSTDLTHRGIVEDIFELFRADYRLGGNAQKIEPVNVEFSGQVDKGGKFLHYAAVILIVTEDIP